MRKIIFLIEDDWQIIDVYKIALEKTNDFKIETATLGQEAVEKLDAIEKGKAKKPDLILLDLVLPDMNGIEVLQEIKSRKKTKDIPVFILTNYGDEELKKMGVDLKSEKYLTKTETSPIELRALVKEQLGEK